MIRNGRNIRKPIWNAVLSSLVTKAGSRIEKGTSCGAGEALDVGQVGEQPQVVLAGLASS